MTAAGQVFPWLSVEDSELRALVIETAALNGEKLDARIVGALQDISFERTILGASVLSLVMLDPYGDLLDSGLFSQSVDFELPAPNGRMLSYRMVRVKTGPPTLTVEFEERAVYRVRSRRRVRKASRAEMTRAEFVRMLVREVGGIPFFSPELKVKQPIGKVQDVETEAKKKDERAPGFGSSTPTVKGKNATRSQIRLLEQALDTAISRGDPEDAMIGLVMAMTQESVVVNMRGVRTAGGNPGGEAGPLIDVGVLHQNSRYWPATRDVPKDVTPFLSKLRASLKAHKDQSIGWNVDQVQRSYTVNTPQQGKDYDQWESEARETVAAYTGDADLTAGAGTQQPYRKRYEFRTTEPGAEKRIDWWTATGALADEVQFRRFVDLGTFFYVSDEYLQKQAARQSITRDKLPAGVVQVRVGDFDTGKPKATIEITVFLDVLEPPIGAVWVIHGYGPCDGRYLITKVNGSYLNPKAVVTLEKARPILPEPAPEVASRVTQSGDPVRGSVRAGTVQGGSLEDAYNKAWEIDGKRYPYVWGGGHARVGSPDTGTPGSAPQDQPGISASDIGYDCSGSVGAVCKAAGYWPADWGTSVPASGTFAAGWGRPGEGKYFTVWANSVHVYIEFKNMTTANKTEHFGTGRWGENWSGPGMKPKLHPHAGFTPRHWDDARPNDTSPTTPGTHRTGKPMPRD